MTMRTTKELPSLPMEEASTADLVKEALEEARELVRLEIALAKSEVERDLAKAKKAGVLLGIALASGVLVLSLLAMALVLALGGTALVALGVAAVFLAVAAATASAGWAKVPKKPLERTRERALDDVRELKEHIA